MDQAHLFLSFFIYRYPSHQEKKTTYDVSRGIKYTYIYIYIYIYINGCTKKIRAFLFISMKNRETISEKNLKFRHHDFHTKNEKETTRRTTCFFFFFFLNLS